MEAINVMEIVALVITAGMMFSGLQPVSSMYKTGDTRNVPYIMFLLSTVSCLGMLHYGIILNLLPLIIINLLGAVLNVLYTAVYLIVVKDKARPMQYLSVSVAVTAMLYGYLYIELDADEARIPFIGSYSSGITTFLMALPALELVDNFKNCNADGMPWLMNLMCLACGLSWFIYGLMLADIFIYGPNIPGMLVGVVKLYVFHLYGQMDPNANKKRL